MAHGPRRLNGGGNQILTGYPRSARFASVEGAGDREKAEVWRRIGLKRGADATS